MVAVTKMATNMVERRQLRTAFVVLVCGLSFMQIWFAAKHSVVVSDRNNGFEGDSINNVDTVVVNHRITNSDVSTKIASKWNQLCYQNPYIGALQMTQNNTDALIRASNSAMEWINKKSKIDYRNAGLRQYFGQNHHRFFPFRKLAKCQSLSCIGGSCGDDTSKIVCGVEQLELKGQAGYKCIIYSIGGNNLWQFELDLLDKTPCEVHTFDCTGDISRFDVPVHPRLHFHHICLGAQYEPAPKTPVLDDSGICVTKVMNATDGKVVRIQKCGETWTLLQMQQQLNHSRIDLFKIDTEGWEWPLFYSWPELLDQISSINILLPMQILVEIHYRTKFPELLAHYNHSVDDREFKFARDMVELNSHFVKMGYVVVARDDNRFCRHCTELTLLRIFCPSKGVYANQDI